MKPFILSLIIAVSVSASVTNSFAQAPAGFKPGYIVKHDNTRIEGFIKENFASKGALYFIAGAGKKTSYAASDLKEVGIESTVYISHLTDFFKVIRAGSKASLYQKVSSTKGQVLYNGSEAIGVSAGTEGSVNDYFLGLSSERTLRLVTKQNFQQLFTTYCADCPVFVENIRANKIGYTEIEKVIESYNDCQ